jgi:DNA-binding response OmpR family regulator
MRQDMQENAPAKVLVVEDNEPMSRLIASTLRPDGYEVTIAATQADGIKAAESRPDVLILDMLLPDGDGNGVIREVVKNNYTKIICLTGRSSLARMTTSRSPSTRRS